MRVQGNEAAQEIISAVQQANNRGVADVIVICRGGGSLEDLWPFNDELLARCVFQSPLPVVSAIGHEIDFTILDFVADMRAPTPSAAAEMVVPSRRDLKAATERLRERLASALRQRLGAYRQTLTLQKRLLSDPTSLLQNLRLRIDHLQSNLIYSLKDHQALRSHRLHDILRRLKTNSPQHTITSQKKHLSQLQKSIINSIQNTTQTKLTQTKNATALLTAVSPKAVLERGYSIVYTDPANCIVSSSKQVTPGDKLRIFTNAGTIKSQVTAAS
nr:exodeoxyribonuclease VII large subunit [Desulfobulbaceae bacterium]